MSVSHYVVSWIQVIGLILGLYGFFFLSISIFGQTTMPGFRALLPATAGGLAVFLARPQLWVSALAIGGMMYLFALVVPFDIPRPPREQKESSDLYVYDLYVYRVLRLVLYVLPAMAVVLTVVYIAALVQMMFRLLQGSLTKYDLSVIGNITLGLVYVWSMVSVLWLPRILGEARLQKLGVFMSVVALLTPFIPPVLDLLNIPITK